MLKSKNAIIYGAGGSIGGAIATVMAATGARVFLAGRTVARLQAVATKIRAAGGQAEADEVDALDEAAVNQYVDKVVRTAGTIDISFNLISLDPVQNITLAEMSVEDFTRPVSRAMKSHFLTSIAAVKVMKKQGSGVILTLTATPGGIGYPMTGGFAPACCAIESFSRNLASEVGIHGVRVVNIRSGGSPDSQVFKEAMEKFPDIVKPILSKMKADTMLKELPLMEDISNVAVFLASPLAGKITGVTVDVTAGTTAGLNYRMEGV